MSIRSNPTSSFAAALLMIAAICMTLAPHAHLLEHMLQSWVGAEHLKCSGSCEILQLYSGSTEASSIASKSESPSIETLGEERLGKTCVFCCQSNTLASALVCLDASALPRLITFRDQFFAYEDLHKKHKADFKPSPRAPPAFNL